MGADFIGRADARRFFVHFLLQAFEPRRPVATI
jgi:hypothetical protein